MGEKLAAANQKADLPYDVWLGIAGYLEPAIRRRLIALNRAFLDTVLNDRYREIDFSLADPITLYTLKRLQDTFVASRVRTLNFSPTSFFANEEPRSPDQHFGEAENEIGDKIEDIFRMLDGLTTLNLYICYGYDCNSKLHPSSLPSITTAWSILGAKLHTLSLSLPFEIIEQALSPLPTLETLEALVISIFRSGADVDGRHVISTRLVPFVNNQTTLRSFTFSDVYWLPSDPPPTYLLLGMGYFPHLRKLDISINSDEGGSDIWRILRRHANTLEELNISHHVSVSLTLYDGPALSALTTLSLGLSVEWEYTSKAVTSLQRMCTSIISLRLTSFEYSYVNMCNILDIFAQNDRLQSLSIELDFLSPQSIDFLSGKMPELQSLYLSINDYKGDLDHDGSSELQQEIFCEEMSKRQYPGWGIKTLEIEVYSAGPKVKECTAALERLFPWIQVWVLEDESWV